MKHLSIVRHSSRVPLLVSLRILFTVPILLILLTIPILFAAASVATAQPVKVEIRQKGDTFHLVRGGQPYFVRGVGYGGGRGAGSRMTNIAALGGNSIRSGARSLDEAQAAGLTVTVGLNMPRKSNAQFDYEEPEHVQKQLEQTRAQVLAAKDHPAVLLWGIGNELEGDESVWDAVNAASKAIHEIDPNHPTMTVLGGLKPKMLRMVAERCTDLDLLGLNAYGGLEDVPKALLDNGWRKPYVITEGGLAGDWDVPTTRWGAAIEETSTEKAERFIERYRNTVVRDSQRCLGNYTFIWSWRMERTQTWYGMFLETGERTERVDAQQYLWTNRWPENRSPRLSVARIDGKAPADSVYLQPGTSHTAAIEATDPDGDPLSLRWEIVGEIARAGYAGRGEVRSKPMPELIQQTTDGQIVFTAPEKEGGYRVFIFVTDGQGNGATANIPFCVKN